MELLAELLVDVTIHNTAKFTDMADSGLRASPSFMGRFAIKAVSGKPIANVAGCEDGSIPEFKWSSRRVKHQASHVK